MDLNGISNTQFPDLIGQVMEVIYPYHQHRIKFAYYNKHFSREVNFFLNSFTTGSLQDKDNVTTVKSTKTQNKVLKDFRS